MSSSWTCCRLGLVAALNYPPPWTCRRMSPPWTRGGNSVRTPPPERKMEPYGASYDQKAFWRRPIFGLKVPLAPGLGITWPKIDFGVILGSIFRANVAKCMEGCSKSSLSEFTSQSRGSSGDGPRPAVQTPRFFTPGARMTAVKQTPSNQLHSFLPIV